MKNAASPQGWRRFSVNWQSQTSIIEREHQDIKLRDRTQLPAAVVSTQVIHELAANLIKKADFVEAQIREIVGDFYQDCEVADADRKAMLTASRLREKYHLSYWDSLIAAAALETDCATLYTEDMQHGLVIETSLTIIDPFV